LKTAGLGDFWPQNYGGYWLVGWQECKQLSLVELMCECTIVAVAAVFYFYSKIWIFMYF
jgi:hypothetical protein